MYDLDLENQREQFSKVIEHLLKTGIKKKEIAARIALSTYDISHILSGAIKNITIEVLENLHAEFGINPNYIRKGTSNMFDIPGMKFENFEAFVDKWDLVEHENKKYLHFTIDENFYKFLIDVYDYMVIANPKTDVNEKKEAFTEALNALKNNFPDIQQPQEYVLIPADDMIEITSNNISRQKNLSEVIDIINL
jgi:DNA-binding Xre family transcriptional regulator